jgi:hypothetical protein
MSLFWWWNSEQKYTLEEVSNLVEKIKEFDAGCIDEYLSNHVDKVYAEWQENVER